MKSTRMNNNKHACEGSLLNLLQEGGGGQVQTGHGGRHQGQVVRAQADQGSLGEAELGQAGQRGQVQLETEAEVVVGEVQRGEGREAAGGEVSALPPPHPHQLSPGHLHTSLVQL